MRAIHQRANLRAMVEDPPSKLVDPNKLLAQIGPMWPTCPTNMLPGPCTPRPARSAHGCMDPLARAKTYVMMVDRYPAHPLALEAYRWLLHTQAAARHAGAGTGAVPHGAAVRAWRASPGIAANEPRFSGAVGGEQARPPSRPPKKPEQLVPSRRRSCHGTAMQPPGTKQGKQGKKEDVKQAGYSREEMTQTEIRRQQATAVLTSNSKARK